MISQQQRKELALIKPPKYRLKVQKHLQDKGVMVSTSFIGKVYLGTRNNPEVEKAIAVVFTQHQKETLEEAKAIEGVFNQYQKDKDSLKTNVVDVC
ncbi:hypothetical protein [Tenacibaculum halocynthiae]|uniref:hypothetical protein n=1 Tax=Tenacibaculum halocynthiae TaxID=1254437 RepID=UPI003D65BACD